VRRDRAIAEVQTEEIEIISVEIANFDGPPALGLLSCVPIADRRHWKVEASSDPPRPEALFAKRFRLTHELGPVHQDSQRCG